VIYSQLKTSDVARGQSLGFTTLPALPNWAYGVNDPTCLEAIGARNSSLSGLASAQSAAFFLEIGAGCVVNRAINATPAEKRAIRGIYNRIDVQGRDVGTDRVDSTGHLAPMGPQPGETDIEATLSPQSVAGEPDIAVVMPASRQLH
jgi:hypothetical protein